MKKTIIAVFGVGNQGKTESIRALLRLLMTNNPNEPISVDGRPIYVEIDEPDFYVTIQVGEFLIGITSQGDPKTGLKGRLWELAKLNCDIIICSSRTRGETVRAVVDVEKKSEYNAIWFSNFKGGGNFDRSALNATSARSIESIIQGLLNNQI